MTLVYGSICSGIEAASVAWRPLGWRAAFVAEIEPFPAAVLAHHYPEVPNLGDFIRIETVAESIDVLVGGTPCQSFSVSGKRGGLDDARGVLAIEFLRLARRLRPRWVVFENVPGFLSSGFGRDFGTFLGLMGQLGYGWAYRVLDAQYFGVPQRRRRVFVVGYSGGWQRAAAVLFERHSMSRNSPPSRETGARITGSIAARTGAGGGLGTDFDCDGGLIAQYLSAGGPNRYDYESETFVMHALRANGFDAGEGHAPAIVQPYTLAIRAREDGCRLEYRCDGTSNAVRTPWGGTGGINVGAIAHETAVRRLTPRECERLQGFPDDYTLVPYRGKPATDGPRYKAIGNSMAVPVMRWIGQRIAMVDSLKA
jgi:DNA (cytosine-5)-methyltransferase 1